MAKSRFKELFDRELEEKLRLDPTTTKFIKKWLKDEENFSHWKLSIKQWKKEIRKFEPSTAEVLSLRDYFKELPPQPECQSIEEEYDLFTDSDSSDSASLSDRENDSENPKEKNIKINKSYLSLWKSAETTPELKKTKSLPEKNLQCNVKRIQR